jgi:trehalose 6-phosphate synthase/phosphatase
MAEPADAPATAPDGKLIIVANRLPVALKDGGFVPTSGGLSSALQSAKADCPFLWLGSLAQDADAAGRASIEAQLAPLGCVPVWMAQRTYDAYYAFSNEVLWPTLHSFTGGVEADFQGDPDAYLAANAAFCAAVVAAAGPRDTIWVHDYHLLPLPRLLRAALPATVRLGFFLHTPFCASSHWRTLPLRQPLLEGVLGADLAGFHTLRDVGHFASACAKTLPRAAVAGSAVAVGGRAGAAGRATALGAFPIGIDPAPFVEAVASGGACAEKARTWAAFYAGHPLVVSCDRLDPIKGLEEKLLGFRALLARCAPPAARRPCLLALCVPSRDTLAAYAGLRRRCDELTAAINAEFGALGAPPPVALLYRTLPHEELAALFAVGAVALVTSLRDGMNLVAFEYTACQEGVARKGGGAPGVLVLSEFAGAAQCLAGALRVQPRDAGDVAEKLALAIGMGAEERASRHAASWAWVSTATAGAWAASFLRALRGGAGGAPPPPAAAAAEVAARWRAARSPALLVSASLLSYFSSDGHAVPAPAMAALAALLARGARVALVSDGAAGALEAAFAGLPPAGLRLVAEGGLAVRGCAAAAGAAAGGGDAASHTAPTPHTRAPSRPLADVFSQGAGEHSSEAAPAAAAALAAAAAAAAAPPAGWRCLLPEHARDPAWKPAAAAILRQAAGLAPGARVRDGAWSLLLTVGDAHVEKFAWVAREAVEQLLELPAGAPPPLAVEQRARALVVAPAGAGLRDAVAAALPPDCDYCVCLADEESNLLGWVIVFSAPAARWGRARNLFTHPPTPSPFAPPPGRWAARQRARRRRSPCFPFAALKTTTWRLPSICCRRWPPLDRPPPFSPPPLPCHKA